MPQRYVQMADITLTVTVCFALMAHTRLRPVAPWRRMEAMYRITAAGHDSRLTGGTFPRQAQWSCARTGITTQAVAVGYSRTGGILVCGNCACLTRGWRRTRLTARRSAGR